MDIKDRYSWLYKTDSLEKLLSLNGLKLLHSTNQSEIYCISNLAHNNMYSVDQIKQALDEGNLSKASEMLDTLNKDAIKEECCHVIFIKKFLYFYVITNKFNRWKHYFLPFEPVNTIDKTILKRLIDSNVCDNLLNLTVKFCNSSNIMNTNLHGSMLQHTIDFQQIIDSQDTEVINCVFQPKNKSFLVTLKYQNFLEMSKYANSHDYIEYLTSYCSFLNQ